MTIKRPKRTKPVYFCLTGDLVAAGNLIHCRSKSNHSMGSHNWVKSYNNSTSANVDFCKLGALVYHAMKLFNQF